MSADEFGSRKATQEFAQFVTSKDGTVISFLTVGRGPAVIAIPGVLSTAASYASFADALGQNYTVHTIERRGRGRSGPQGDGYGISKEIEDVLALQEATNASLIFGHSYGGLIALEVARNNDAIAKIAIYEPGVSVDGSIALGWTSAFRRKLAEGKPLDAFATMSIAAGPSSAERIPPWFMKLVLRMFIGANELKQIFDLLPASLLEHQVVGQLDNTYRNYQQIGAEVLIMRGGKSGLGWTATATAALAVVVPSVAVQEFPRLDHFGPDKSGPVEVARAVGTFYS